MRLRNKGFKKVKMRTEQHKSRAMMTKERGDP